MKVEFTQVEAKTERLWRARLMQLLELGLLWDPCKRNSTGRRPKVERAFVQFLCLRVYLDECARQERPTKHVHTACL